MIALIAVVLGLQLAGEIIARWLGLPVPGPVIAMLALFVALSFRAQAALSRLANTLLGHLSLLFVPAGVGVINYLGRLSEHWLAIGATLVASTLIAITTTALTLRWLKRPDVPDDSDPVSEP
jgi:holin-like protein